MSLLAYRGQQGCTSAICTNNPVPDDGRCYGWHCATCHVPCSLQGHDCPQRAAETDGAGTPPIGLSLGAFIERVIRDDPDT